MIVGIEETTDHTHPETKIVKLRSKARARGWLAGSGGWAWPGAADERLPVGQQNFHRRMRLAYVMPARYRLSKREVDRLWTMRAGTRGTEAAIYHRDAVEELRAE